MGTFGESRDLPPEGVVAMHDQQMPACEHDIWPLDSGVGWECDNCGWSDSGRDAH